MTKKDFIRVGIMLHLLVNPERRSPKEAAKWSADIWDMTENSEVAKVPRRKTDKAGSHFEKLRHINSQWFEYFCQFWSAWVGEGNTSDSRGRDQAAEQWLIQCKAENLSKEEFKHRIYAGGIYAKFRPGLIAEGSKPIMAYRWLKLRRFDDVKPYEEKESSAQVNLKTERRRELIADLNDFNNKLKLTGDDHWKNEISRVEKELQKLDGGKHG